MDTVHVHIHVHVCVLLCACMCTCNNNIVITTFHKMKEHLWIMDILYEKIMSAQYRYVLHRSKNSPINFCKYCRVYGLQKLKLFALPSIVHCNTRASNGHFI